jgi:predicted membrane channel-forming protein YqfA (hemolysin III family)
MTRSPRTPPTQTPLSMQSHRCVGHVWGCASHMSQTSARMLVWAHMYIPSQLTMWEVSFSYTSHTLHRRAVAEILNCGPLTSISLVVTSSCVPQQSFSAKLCYQHVLCMWRVCVCRQWLLLPLLGLTMMTR